jgi:hypothetical protein
VGKKGDFSYLKDVDITATGAGGMKLRGTGGVRREKTISYYPYLYCRLYEIVGYFKGCI